jgi:hypothetical protein
MSSKRHVRQHRCGRKKPYRSEVEARRVAEGQSKREGRALSIYRCPWAGQAHPHWHVGHSDIKLTQPRGAKLAWLGRIRGN